MKREKTSRELQVKELAQKKKLNEQTAKAKAGRNAKHTVRRLGKTPMVKKRLNKNGSMGERNHKHAAR